MDRYDVLTILASAILSIYAFNEANKKPDVQYIVFENPFVITAKIKNWHRAFILKMWYNIYVNNKNKNQRV